MQKMGRINKVLMAVASRRRAEKKYLLGVESNFGEIIAHALGLGARPRLPIRIDRRPYIWAVECFRWVGSCRLHGRQLPALKRHSRRRLRAPHVDPWTWMGSNLSRVGFHEVLQRSGSSASRRRLALTRQAAAACRRADARFPYDPRGARHQARSSRHKLVFGRSGRIGTMMQSYAAVAKLRGAAVPF